MKNMRRRWKSLIAEVLVVLAMSVASPMHHVIAQDVQSTHPSNVLISDSPKTVDPATLMPAAIAKPASVKFEDASIREVADWLRSNCSLPVLINERSFVDAGLSLNETINDRLENQPLYLLLNRLRNESLDWYVEDAILHIVAVNPSADKNRRMSTRSTNVGDLIDAGYLWDEITDTIVRTVAPDSWDDVGGEGTVEIFGDVLFVRTSDELHMQVQGLLAALREHGRQTFIADPAQHIAIRERLSTNISVAFDDTPLEEAIADVAAQSKIDVRLDVASLRKSRIRGREPVRLHLQDRSVKAVIRVLMDELKLSWILVDGVMWITTQEVADSVLKTAIYDVRDLCRNRDEANSLKDAIASQAHPDSWDDVGGEGAIEFPLPGTMVILTQEPIHNTILDLLEKYRTALKSSKRRNEYVDPDSEVLTHYYKLHTPVALGIERYIRENVMPETWTSEDSPNAVGFVHLLPSTPQTKENSEAIVEQSVLVIRQTRPAHREISELIKKVTEGSPYRDAMGGIGGGMGGGMFRVSPEKIERQRRTD